MMHFFDQRDWKMQKSILDNRVTFDDMGALFSPQSDKPATAKTADATIKNFKVSCEDFSSTHSHVGEISFGGLTRPSYAGSDTARPDRVSCQCSMTTSLITKDTGLVTIYGGYYSIDVVRSSSISNANPWKISSLKIDDI